ncbi:hypothetical protein LCGC14_1123290 [marine sediment metagenome]|uniref:AAA+ ATPase domain-containing protein n=1 Tax=marine sediment metagenome TaxID=412755 RepID=A0A0F9MR51_9ZZZZ
MSEEVELWMEKYRPKTLDEVIDQTKIKNSCRNYIKSGKFPHLIFSGPAGVGKTTIAKIIASDVSGTGNTMILNASDENSIKVMRGPVKEWVMSLGEYAGRLKTLILDEGDNITFQAQQAIRVILEDSSNYFRMILTCNYPNKIIDPIKSRCIEFKFSKIPSKLIIKRLWEVNKEQHIELTLTQIKKIVLVYSGDMRKCYNVMNAVYLGAEFDVLIRNVNPILYLKLVASGNLRGIRDYLDKNIFGDRDMSFLINRCMEIIVSNIGNSKLEKIGITKGLINPLLKNLAEADYRLTNGTQYYSIAFWIALKIGEEKIT